MKSCLLAVLVAALLAPMAAHAAGFVPDQGLYRVYQQDHLLGVERINFEQRSDSLVMTSKIRQRLPRGLSQQDTLAKTAMLVLGIKDGAWRSYQSYEQMNGDMLTRILTVADTTYTSLRQGSEGGFGDTFASPPGRVYVVDPQVFALFDVLCRDMHAQSFEERTVTLLYVTSRDTVVTARVKRLGKVPFKLGKETVTAEKFSITDPWSEFIAWVSPNGRMLRLTLPAVGLRVDRDPASLKTHPVARTNTPVPSGIPSITATYDLPAKPGKPEAPATPKPDPAPAKPGR